MTRNIPEKECDLMIVGAGIAGLAAALFAANRGMSIAHVGSVSELNFASGLLDLLAVHPVESGRVWEDPYAARLQLVRDEPEHPYARVAPERIEAAFAEFARGLEDGGQPVHIEPGRNTTIVTQLGMLKTTYAVPLSMQHASVALKQKEPWLIVGFRNLRGFSARMIARNLASRWPGIRHATIQVPGFEGELYNEPLARALEASPGLEKLAEAIRPHLGDEASVGLPAVLGVRAARRLHKEMEALLGRKVFEIPTMLPAVTGMRIREALTRVLNEKGVGGVYHLKVNRAGFENDRFHFEIGAEEPTLIIHAKAAVLATGRFFGRGLHADRHRITETLFNLPVHQPQGREEWYSKEYFDPHGHPINRAGIEVDDRFRPIGPDGEPVYERLFAAGSVLAHQDWKRQKCGSGLAIATALAAVEEAGRMTG